MKDTPKNFGLPQSLIDAVKNVVGEELEHVEESYSLKGMSLSDLQDKKRTAENGRRTYERAATAAARVGNDSEFRRNRAKANQHDDDLNRINAAIKNHPDNPKNEEVDLEEARRTPEQEAKAKKMAKLRASKSKAAQAAKAAAPPKPKKPQAYVSPDKPKGAENETPNDDTRDPRENIINQLRKQPVEGKHTITFRNGKTHLLSPAIVNKARTLHANMHPRDKGDFQERLAASLESFQDAVKNPEGEAEKKTNPLDPKPLGKDFMARLSAAAARHKNKNK